MKYDTVLALLHSLQSSLVSIDFDVDHLVNFAVICQQMRFTFASNVPRHVCNVYGLYSRHAPTVVGYPAAQHGSDSP